MFLSSVRVPSIKFIGKRSLALLVKDIETSPAKDIEATTTKDNQEDQGNGIYFGSLKGAAFFGRPNLSDVEIGAIESGGAEIIT